MAYNFEYFSPTKVYFGRGAEKNTGRYIREYGAKNIMLVYGGSSAKKSGLLDLIRQSLRRENIVFSEIGGVVPNPRLDKVYEGIRLGRKSGTDFLLAIGGGSAIDTAKAIAYGLGEPERDVWELYEHTRKAEKCLPVASVLTIAASGSETSKGSVITDEKTGSKRAYDDNLARPVFAVMNPEYTMTLPDYQTESGCVDIMMHTMERYFTNGGNMEITDALAEGLLRTVMENAVILHTNPQNYDARAEVMWAGSLAHNDLTGCGNDGGDFMSHKLEHELGVSAAGTDEEIAEAGIRAMENFYHKIGMPTNLAELGVEPSDEQIKEMAGRCMAACGGHTGSAKALTEGDMVRIYTNAK